jgi:hypothetical protein
MLTDTAISKALLRDSLPENTTRWSFPPADVGEHLSLASAASNGGFHGFPSDTFLG